MRGCFEPDLLIKNQVLSAAELAGAVGELAADKPLVLTTRMSDLPRRGTAREVGWNAKHVKRRGAYTSRTHG